MIFNFSILLNFFLLSFTLFYFYSPNLFNILVSLYSIFFSPILFSSALHYSILFYSILFYYIPFSFVLFHFLRLYSILLHFLLFYFVLYSILFYSILFFSVLFYSILFSSILFSSISLSKFPFNLNSGGEAGQLEYSLRRDRDEKEGRDTDRSHTPRDVSTLQMIIDTDIIIIIVII